MSALNMLLAIVLALATVVQAGTVWMERETPLYIVLYEKKISAITQAGEMIEEGCRLRFVPPKDRVKVQEDWVAMMTKRRQAQLALALVGDEEILKILDTAYEKEDVFDGKKYLKEQPKEVMLSFGKAFGESTIAFWGCNRIAKEFLASARKALGLHILTQASLDKFLRGGPPRPLGQPETMQEQ